MSQVADLSPDRTELLPMRRVSSGCRTCLAAREVLLLPNKAILRVLGGGPAQHVPACEGGAALAGHGSCGHVPAPGGVLGAPLEPSARRQLRRQPRGMSRPEAAGAGCARSGKPWSGLDRV